MDDPLNPNDRIGTSPLEKTIKGLARLLAPQVTLLDTPFLMLSYGSASEPVLITEAPYFKGNRVRFVSKFRQAIQTKDNFCFLIMATSIKNTTSSHAMVGWWHKGVLTLFDPNGDFYTPDPESVYNGYGYFIAPQRDGLKNPLYNTLINYFSDLANIRVYTADIIPCPRGESRTCMYRSLMYIIATGKSSDPVKVVRYTSKLVKTKFNELKDLVKISSLYLDTNDVNIRNLFNVTMNLNVSPEYRSILSSRQSLPLPQPPRTRPLPLRPLRRRYPGKQRMAAS